MPQQINPFADSAEDHRHVVVGTALTSVALVLTILIAFPALIERHLNAPVVLSTVNTLAPTADDRYLQPDQVLAVTSWWLIPFAIFLIVFVRGMLKRRSTSTLVGAAGLAAFGSIHTGLLIGIAVTNVTDVSPTLQPLFCVLIYVVLSTPFLMAFIRDLGMRTRRS